jgi:adenosine deaminase
VTVNTDNRLVTNTTVSKELWLCHTEMGFTFDDLKQVILSGFKSAFLPFHVKQQYLRRVSDELNAFVHAQAAPSRRRINLHAAGPQRRPPRCTSTRQGRELGATGKSHTEWPQLMLSRWRSRFRDCRLAGAWGSR